LSLYGTSETLKLDSEGRVVLTDSLKAHAGITDAATFVGLGYKFRIWEPSRFRAELAEATEKVRAFKQERGTRVAAAKPLGARECEGPAKAMLWRADGLATSRCAPATPSNGSRSNPVVFISTRPSAPAVIRGRFCRLQTRTELRSIATTLPSPKAQRSPNKGTNALRCSWNASPTWGPSAGGARAFTAAGTLSGFSR